MTMTTVPVLCGLLFIALGFLTLKYPGIIKNWRYATEEQRKNIDIKALQLLSCKSMVVSGTALIIIGIISYFIKGSWPIYAIIIIIFAMSGYMVARMRRFDKNPESRRNRTIAAAVLAVSLFVIVGLFIGGKMESKIQITDNQLIINGMYNETIPLTDIDTIYISPLTDLPKIEMRTNGYADGEILKGYFRLTDWGKCKLIIHDIQQPAIVIHYNNKHLILNLYNPTHTASLYNQLKQ